MGATTAVQRYRQVAAQDYAASPKVEFRSQDLERGASTARYRQVRTRKPDLKVAGDGSLAIEAAASQPKVFFAEPSVVERSNIALEDADSAVRLTEGGKRKRIRVPVGGGSLNSLSSVGWRPAGNQDLLAAISVCSDVADKVAGGIERTEAALVLQEHGTEGAAPSTAISFSAEPLKGALYHALAEKPSAEGLVRANEAHAEVVADQDAWENAFRSEIQNGIIEADAVRYLIRLAVTPGEVLGKVKALINRAYRDKPQPSPVTEAELGIILSKAYGGQPRGRARERSRRLGVNEYAAPEVGEAYATFPVGGRDFTGEHPAFRQRIEEAEGEVDEAVEALRGTQVTDGWTWHLAAVVATSLDGKDRVTLENYNREVEKDKAKRKIFAGLRGQFEEMNRLLVGLRAPEQLDAGAMKELLQKAEKRASQELQPAVYRALESFRQLDATPGGGLWYFGMYGPAEEQVDGGTQDQSFHRAMVATGDFANPITYRLRGKATEGKVKQEIAADEHLSRAHGLIAQILNGALGGVAGKGYLLELVERARAALESALASANQGRRLRRMEYLEAYDELGETLTDLERLIGSRAI